MKFSVNWLREFVDLPVSLDELSELLTLAGVEIAAIEQRGANIDKIVVAQITASAPHPNADRLTVCQVDDGTRKKRQIVCGATNYKVGDKVPLALPGVTLPNGLKIRQSKLRGVDSEGMLCSAIELGLGQDAAGLLILSPDAKIGAPIADLFPADTILDVEITPNRSDLLSHYGLAREIAALVGAPLRGVREVGRFGDTALPEKDGVHITALRECPFYSVRRIENVKVGPSPEWLRARIESVGIRSINNVVDITNFVMLELGQPLHAFDADKLKGEITVRLARDGEKFLALDGKTYSLTPEDLMIADAERAVAIAGVMGGEDTGVIGSTKNVLLESAYFLPTSVRRTARNLNLPSDSSYRFERGVDPMTILPASSRAAQLMREIADGNPAKEIAAAGKVPANPPDVSLGYNKCNQVLGIEIPPKKVDEILERFGLREATSTRLPEVQARPARKSKAKKEESTWKIPSYRRDLQRDVDLVEEIVRAYGVQKIAGTDRSRFTPTSPADISHDLESALREQLAARGLAEARSSKLIPRRQMAFAENAIELRNPLSEDHVALRPSLLAGLLGVLERNVRAGAERVAVFELGRVFLPPSGKEERRLGILLWGALAGAPYWRSLEKRQLDFVDLKGAIESIAASGLSFVRTEHRDLSLAVEIRSGNSAVGMAGQLASSHATALDAPGAVLLAELNVDLILGAFADNPVFRELERFPTITRDIAMIVPEKIAHEAIVRVIGEANEPLLESVQLFDLFVGEEGSSVGAGRKSLAYRLTYRDRSRTLTSEEVTAVHAKIRERLQREVGAELRE
jgi:phenylalanyl-tRNA synthetase beta chain